MKCELVTQVQVDRFAVLADMARLDRRPELVALCRAARDKDGRIDSRIVAQVLPGLSAAGCDNVVMWCRMLHLCDEHGVLTTLGHSAVETGEVPVPEQGVFELWVTTHPLLGARILHVERVKSTRDGRFDLIAPLPITPDRDRVFPSVLEPAARWVFRGLPANGNAPGCMRKPVQARCTIRWSMDFSSAVERFRLEGVLEGEGWRRALQHAPEPAGIDLSRLLDDWTRVYLSRFGRWLPEGRLAVALADASEAAQETFRRSFPIGAIEALDRGTYAGVTLHDVPIAPATKVDADGWARARLERRLRGEPKYRTRADLRRLFASVVEGTPLEGHRPALPAHAALLRAHESEPAVSFALAAPVDLSPFEIEAPELDAFTFGEPATLVERHGHGPEAPAQWLGGGSP